MRIYDIIAKKRDGGVLSKEEIDFVINGYTKGEIADYQMSALLMAIFINKMNDEELVNLTSAMMNSGNTLDLSMIKGIITDKHSTGGVGDKISLILAPLVAAADVHVAMLSGRGLGHTGGTLDKLESIPGMNVFLPIEKFINNIQENYFSIMGQTENLAPADKKIYALRDATATVNSIHLIASSIMSKKLAAGPNVIVMDVKTGTGAFMSDMEDAKELAQKMIAIGDGMGREVVGLITNMNQPLGKMVGNSLEVIESIDTLKNNGPDDVTELTLALGALMLKGAKKVETFQEGYAYLTELLKNGKALERFKKFVELQGGDIRVVDDYSILPKANNIIEIKSKVAGYISRMDTYKIGAASVDLGAGRHKKEDAVDFGVGFEICKKIGDFVHKGETLVKMHINNMVIKNDISKMILDSYSFSQEPIKNTELIYYFVSKDGIFPWKEIKDKI